MKKDYKYSSTQQKFESTFCKFHSCTAILLSEQTASICVPRAPSIVFIFRTRTKNPICKCRRCLNVNVLQLLRKRNQHFVAKIPKINFWSVTNFSCTMRGIYYSFRYFRKVGIIFAKIFFGIDVSCCSMFSENWSNLIVRLCDASLRLCVSCD